MLPIHFMLTVRTPVNFPNKNQLLHNNPQKKSLDSILNTTQPKTPKPNHQNPPPKMGCVPSKPIPFFQKNPITTTTTSYRRRRRRQTARSVGYEQLLNEGKGGVKSSRLNRVRVDEGGEIWYY